MASVTLQQVCKVYPGDVYAVRDFELEIADGEFLVLVGPSGCGKSTTLRMIAGLETISSGTLSSGDRVVNDVHPKDRDIAMVFQNYALYPHMSVRENMAFALKMRRTPREEIAQRVEWAAGMLGLGHLLDRKPRALSGGQRQRVALGPGHRPPARGLPLRRAALQPRREAPGGDTRRDQAAPPRAQDHHRLRHPRPRRGHDARRPRGRDVRRRDPSGRHAAEHLPEAGRPLRLRFPRHAADELLRGRPGARRRARLVRGPRRAATRGPRPGGMARGPAAPPGGCRRAAGRLPPGRSARRGPALAPGHGAGQRTPGQHDGRLPPRPRRLAGDRAGFRPPGRGGGARRVSPVEPDAIHLFEVNGQTPDGKVTYGRSLAGAGQPVAG